MAKRAGKELYVVEAMSAGKDAGDFAKIIINDEIVEMERNENYHFRGLHIVVLNPYNGEIVFKKVFDTYTTSALFDDFIDGDTIKPGFIVAAACKDECVKGLSNKARKWFADMGSKEIYKVKYR